MTGTRGLTLLGVFLLVAALTPLSSQTTGGERRVAFVIGNNSYAVGPLANPVHDASDIAEVLQRIGFEVTLTLNRTLLEMEDDLAQFSASLLPGDVVFFFYAGHAVQVDGENFLLPIDNEGIRDRAALRRRAISAQEYIDKVQEAATRLNVVVLDACRDNPLPGDARSGARGLAPIRPSRGSETAIVFSTSAGEVAEDGTGRNSVFTKVLLTELEQPDQDVYQLFNQVGRAVRDKTNGVQIPAFYTGPLSPFVFVSSQQLAQEAEQFSQIARATVSSIEAEIASLQEMITAASLDSERRELELESRRRESQLAAAQLEARQLQEEAQRRAEEAATAQQMQERMRRLAEESRAQQLELSELVAVRREQLEALRSHVDTDDPDQLIASILEIERTLAAIATEYETVWETVEHRVNGTFDRQLASLDEVEPNFWETDDRFIARITEERSSVELERERVLNDRYDEIQQAERGQAQPLVAQLEATKQALYEQSWFSVGDDVDLEFTSFDRNSQRWSFTLTSNNPAVPVQNWPVEFLFAVPLRTDDSFKITFDRSAEAPLSEVQEFENARRAGALAGRISWTIRRGEGDIFETWVDSIDVLNLANNQSYSYPMEQIVAEFQPGQRMSPLPWVPVRISSRADYPAEVLVDGTSLGRIGEASLQTFLPLQRNVLHVYFDSGLDRRVSFDPRQRDEITVIPPVARVEFRRLLLATNLFSAGMFVTGENDSMWDTATYEELTTLPRAYFLMTSGLQVWGGLTIKTRNNRPVFNSPVVAAYGMYGTANYEYTVRTDFGVLLPEEDSITKLAAQFGAGWGFSRDQAGAGSVATPGDRRSNRSLESVFTSHSLVLMPVLKVSRYSIPEPAYTFSTTEAGGMIQFNFGRWGIQFTRYYDLTFGDSRGALELRLVPTVFSEGIRFRGWGYAMEYIEERM